MKKKVISVLLATAMVTGLVAGCGSKGNDSKGSGDGEYAGVELTFWSMWSNTEPQGKVLQEAASAWEEETGATVNIEWKGRDIKNILGAALEASEDFDLYEDDYNRIAKNWIEWTADLTDLAEAAGYADNSYAVFNDQATEWAGFLPCVTEQPQVGGIFYDKAAFEAAGITELPTTWDEFMAACEALKTAGITPLALDATYADFTFYHHLVHQLGEDRIEELALNGGWDQEPGVAAAAQDIIDFVNAGYLVDGAPDEFPSSQNKIGYGLAAMIVCANYVTAEVNNNTQTEVDWGMMSYPAVDDGAANSATYAGANSLAITKYSENPQAAFDFIMTLVTGEFDQMMADTAKQIPADSRNTAPALQDGTVEVLLNAESPMSWCASLQANSDLKDSIKTLCINLYDGKFATGEEFAAAMQALY